MGEVVISFAGNEISFQNLQLGMLFLLSSDKPLLFLMYLELR
jgi:hypothetical protein